MSTYEIDDEVVRCLVDNYDMLPSYIRQQVRDLEKQIPLPTPTKLGAVVRTESGDVFIRADDLEPSWLKQAETEWRKADEIGRIVEVLSEGVDP